MEIELSDPSVSSEKIPKKVLNKKSINELSANLFSANTGLHDSKDFSVFCSDLQQAENLEEQIRLINVLNKTSPDLISKFASFKGLEQVVNLLSKASLKPSEQSELIEKILSFLNKIPLTSEILEKTKVHLIVENIKKGIEIPEDICSKAFRLLAKWKKPIEDWTAEYKKKDENSASTSEDPKAKDQKAQDHLPDKRFNRNNNYYYLGRNPIKRTYERNRERPHDGIGTRNSESKRNSRIYENRHYNRNYSPSNSMRPRYNGPRDLSNGKFQRRRPYNSFYSNEKRIPKKSLKWADDSNLCTVKFFKFNDEPTAPSITEEEVMQIRQKLMDEENGSHFFQSSEDYKHKESLLEGQSMKLRKDSQKEVQEKLHQMKEKISWTQPKKIKIGNDNMYSHYVGKESIESEVQQKRIANKLPAYYLKEYQIPEQPAYDEINKSSTSDGLETIMIPLHNVNERAEPYELMQMIEEIIQHQDEDEVSDNKENDKIEEESKEENKEKKQIEIKPLKSILKKSKEELRKIREEQNKERELERKEREIERKERELKRKADEMKLESMLKGIIEGNISLENQTEFLEVLKNTKNSKNTLENIKLLLEVKKMQNQQQAQPDQQPQVNQQPEVNEKLEFSNSDKKFNQSSNRRHFQSQDQYYGGQVSKRVKLNPELSNPRQGEHNHYSSVSNRPEIQPTRIMASNQVDRPINTQKNTSQTDLEYQSTTNTEESSTENQRDNQNKKLYKPHNYKTVPCRLYHSSKGCQFGDDCHYIHDVNYAGHETPSMHKYARPLNPLTKNPQTDQRAAPNSDKSYQEPMDIETESFRTNPIVNFPGNQKSHNPNYPQSEPFNSFHRPSPTDKSFREIPNYRPPRQKIHHNSHQPSFNAQQSQYNQTNRPQNQEYLVQSYKNSRQKEIQVPFEKSEEALITAKTFTRTQSSFNRTRPQQQFQQQQKFYSPPQQTQLASTNVRNNTYKTSINVPPNPFITSPQSNEKSNSISKTYRNPVYKQVQQNHGPSFEPSDARRLSNTVNPSTYPQRIQVPEPSSYPSHSQSRQNNLGGRGGLVHNRNLIEKRQYQDVRF